MAPHERDAPAQALDSGGSLPPALWLDWAPEHSAPGNWAHSKPFEVPLRMPAAAPGQLALPAQCAFSHRLAASLHFSPLEGTKDPALAAQPPKTPTKSHEANASGLGAGAIAPGELREVRARAVCARPRVRLLEGSSAGTCSCPSLQAGASLSLNLTGRFRVAF